MDADGGCSCGLLPENFQIIPKECLATIPFEELIEQGSPICERNLDVLRDTDNRVFFCRQKRTFQLSSLLGILVRTAVYMKPLSLTIYVDKRFVELDRS